MVQNTIVSTPTRTVLGDAFRRLGDLVDGGPSILSGKLHQASPVDVTVVMTGPAAVEAVASDLGLPVTVIAEYTLAELRVGPVRLALQAAGQPERYLRRPMDVTETIEEQS